MTEEEKAIRRKIKKKVKPVEKAKQPVIIKKASVPARQGKGAQVFMVGEYKVKSKSLVENKGTWYVSARVPDPATGKVKQVMRSTGVKVQYKQDGTPRKSREAQARMETICDELEKELNQKLPHSDATVEDYVKRSLKNKGVKLQGTTITGYEGYLKKRIGPWFSGVRMQDLSRQMLQEFFNEIAKELSPNTLPKYETVLNGAIDEAKLDGIIATSPMEGVVLPSKIRFEGSAYTKEEVEQIVGLIPDDLTFKPVMVLALYFGLRRSEICGCRWNDIDFENATICVRHTVKEYSNVRYERDHNKTKRSYRTLPIPAGILEYFRTLKQRREETGLIGDKICVMPNGNTINPHYVTTNWGKFVKKHDIRKIRFHDLRHTAASLMLENGAMLETVSAILGHEDIATTAKYYIHIPSKQKIAAMETQGAAIGLV